MQVKSSLAGLFPNPVFIQAETHHCFLNNARKWTTLFYAQLNVPNTSATLKQAGIYLHNYADWLPNSTVLKQWLLSNPKLNVFVWTSRGL